jgi:cation:H+ antiporter
MSLLPLLAILAGLPVLIWSADRFVLGASALARHFGMPALLIGMLIVGFGTSAPEMLVSAIAAWQGNPGLALGNAYGSNIANIALILGLTAVLAPISVHSAVVRREIPVLLAVTALSFLLLWDLTLSVFDAVVLLAVFAGHVAWTIARARDGDLPMEAVARGMPLSRAYLWTLLGLVVLIASSRVFVWGAVELAEALGVSDLVIGLTIVAVGTSLPELASSIAAVRRREHDIALGNVVGSNLFNTLAVVGIAGLFGPAAVPPEVLRRDLVVVALLTLLLAVFCYARGRKGRINRFEGAALLASYAAYTFYIVTAVPPAPAG